MRNKIIVIGGIRGSGKTSLSSSAFAGNYFHFFNDIMREFIGKEMSWEQTEKKIAQKVLKMSSVHKKMVIDLHYAVPGEKLSSDIKLNLSRDVSTKYNECLSSNFLEQFKEKNVEFQFVLIRTDILNITTRLSSDNKRRQPSEDYLKNIGQIKKIEDKMFRKTLSIAQNLGLKFRSSVFMNNQSFDCSLRGLRQIVG